MQKAFTNFANNIRLTANQEADAKTKYTGVCEKLHSAYYSTEYTGNTKLLFGSYKTKTNVRPITENQDVDVLFKIPKETYEKYVNYTNGPSALLQEIKKILNEKYTTTDTIKAWGKVVLVKFSDGTHNVEVLPAYEKDDGKFIIPNTEYGGYWDTFDPREQISQFNLSNGTTNGLTADLARMIKTWVDNTATCNYKSYQLLSDVMKFLESYFIQGATYSEYSEVVKLFFDHLNYSCSNDIQSFVKTALNRAIKAINFEKDEKLKEASEEWRKIFGSEFPLIPTPAKKENTVRIITNPSSPYANYKTNERRY